MNQQALFAISPIDGRYAAKVHTLSAYFSEYAFMKYRVRVEIAYLIALHQEGIPQLSNIDEQLLHKLWQVAEKFSETDAHEIKLTEAHINHDVKAVEYFVKNKLELLGLGHIKEFVHFGLTSQDINNVAIPLMLKAAWEEQLRPVLHSLISLIYDHATQQQYTPMLARTHGQPASPTSLGKEIMVFVSRLRDMLELQDYIPHRAKFGGATGNFNAHFVAFPTIDWHQFGERFVSSLGLERTSFTTQVEPYDHLAAFCQGMCRINTILIDFCRDIWHYISLDYFRQKANPEEVGSSAMPHKVNPIDFENAEGNLGVANALFAHMAEKLPISRLQRDLTDSTVLRNLGVPFAHSLLAYKSIMTGVGKLETNLEALERDLTQHCVVILEGIQTILRREGYPNPYEELKLLFRGGNNITLQQIQSFISKLAVSDAIKQELLQIEPRNYIGKYPNFN